jgi:hypothetical protein
MAGDVSCWTLLNIIAAKSAEISRINRNHQGSKGNDDVTGFETHGKTIKVFSNGFDIFFQKF